MSLCKPLSETVLFRLFCIQPGMNLTWVAQLPHNMLYPCRSCQLCKQGPLLQRCQIRLRILNLQAAWVADLTEHGAPISDCSIVSLVPNAEQETLFVGLDTGALFCIEASAEECSSIEEVRIWVPALKHYAFDNPT